MKHCFLILLLFQFSIKLCGQSSPYLFQNISERHGLADNFCYSILKDSRGILWIGTNNGVSRYDGVHFNNFKAGNDSTTFNNSTILDLCEDKEGNIWGGTQSGIFCYNYKTSLFSNYTTATYDYLRATLNIICDKNGTVWATSEWNVLKFNKHENKFDELQPLTSNKDSLRHYSIRQNGLLEDPAGRGIWLATRSGLHFYNNNEKKPLKPAACISSTFAEYDQSFRQIEIHY